MAVASWSTPGSYSWTVPPGCTSVTIAMQGGGGGVSTWQPMQGGVAGVVNATMAVTSGTVLTVVVGQQGLNSGTSTAGVAGGTGYHAGGAGGGGGNSPGAAGGGGSSAVLSGGTLWAEAGGGGGAGPLYGPGGYGGNPNGATGAGSDAGRGATQSADGAGGTSSVGIPGSVAGGVYGGGGGGGGFYGGEGGARHSTGGAAGGGGSSWAGNGVTGIAYGTAGALANGTVSFTYQTAPLTPVLVSPANGTYVNAASGIPGVAQYNSPGGANQNAAAIRIKVSTGGTYSYLNTATNALQSSPVWNALSAANGAQFSWTFPSGVVYNGASFNWSVASQESSANVQGPFAPDATFTGMAPANLVVNAPTGTVSSAQPNVLWTTTPGTGAVQTAWNVYVESGAFGTQPGSGTAIWNTGGSDQSQSVQIGLPLQQATYRVFVQVQQTGGVWTGWAYTTFTVTYGPVATPVLSGFESTDGNGVSYNQLVFQGCDNYMTSGDSSFEGTAGSIAWSSNCSYADSTAWALDGSYSLAMTCTTAGTIGCATGLTLATGYPARPNTPYRASAYFRAAATGRSCYVSLAFYDSSANQLGGTSSPHVTDIISGSGVQAVVQATSPPNTAYMVLAYYVDACAVNEKHYVDCAGIAPAAAVSWSLGGRVGSTVGVIYCSDDGGNTWQVLPAVARMLNSYFPIPTTTQSVVVTDYESLPTGSRIYRAQTLDPSASDVTASGYSDRVTLANSITGWQLIDPLDPSNSMVVTIQGQDSPPTGSGNHTSTKSTDLSINTPVNSAPYLPQFGLVRGFVWTFYPEFLSQTEYQRFLALAGTTHALLFVSGPMETSWYGVLSGLGTLTILNTRPVTMEIAATFTETASP